MGLKFKLTEGLLILAGSLFSLLPLSAQDQLTRVPADTIAERTISIIGVGDMMFGSSYPSEAYLPPYDNPLLLLGDLADSLKKSDITFGNLEGSFLDDGLPFKKCRDTNLCYLFRMPERYASTLKDCGFDLISLANNHFGDFGWPASLKTRSLLDSMGITYSGTPETSAVVLMIDTLRIGFCAFSTTAGSLNMNDIINSESVVRSLSARSDVVILSFHGGAEGSNYQRVIRNPEKFLGEDRGNVYEFAHRMVDAGADVIFGHGPHVTRALEVYRGRFIAYSLGNFCTYGRFNISGPNGYSPIVKILTTSDGRFISGRIIPVYQGSDGKVMVDPRKQVISKLRELAAMDFPESEVFLTPDGIIKYKN